VVRQIGQQNQKGAGKNLKSGQQANSRNGQIRMSILEFAVEFGTDTQHNLAEDKWK